jgi:hypothetical protein
LVMQSNGSFTHQVWQVYGSPADVNGSDGIGFASERARHAAEVVSGRSIALVNTTAFRTSPGSIAGINKDHPNSSETSLVLDKMPELGKTPRVQRSPLRLSSRDLRSYPLEVFEGNSALRALSLANEALGDHVVDMPGHPPFLVFALLEKFTSCLRLPGLEPLSDASVAVSQAFEMSARVLFSLGISSDVDYTKIDSEPVFGRTRQWLLHVNGSMQIPLIVSIDQIAFAMAKLEHPPCSLIADERNALSSNHRPNGDCFVEIPENTVVVGDGAKRFESTPSFLIRLVGTRNLGDSTNYHLSREIEATLHFVIDQLMKLILPKTLAPPSHLAVGVGGLVSPLKRVFERLCLFICGVKLYRNDQPHARIVRIVLRFSQRIE